MAVIMGLAGAFIMGIVAGSVTMMAFNAVVNERKLAECVISTLDWVERMAKMGRLDEAIAETRAWWKLKTGQEGNNGTY